MFIALSSTNATGAHSQMKKDIQIRFVMHLLLIKGDNKPLSICCRYTWSRGMGTGLRVFVTTSGMSIGILEWNSFWGNFAKKWTNIQHMTTFFKILHFIILAIFSLLTYMLSAKRDPFHPSIHYFTKMQSVTDFNCNSWLCCVLGGIPPCITVAGVIWEGYDNGFAEIECFESTLEMTQCHAIEQLPEYL